ncbi:MAG: nitronate monooxygenase [Thermoleophilaceae bacterium]
MASDAAARFSPDQLEVPIVQAPLAGGPSTPELAAAVANAGGLGFLAAGYRTPETVRQELAELRRQTERPVGLNLFVPSRASVDRDAVDRYARQLAAEAERYDARLGEPREDDDGWDAKLALAAEERPDVVSFAFGCPAPAVVEDLRRAGVAVWITVTTPAEARVARDAGADALIAQGVEAGGHRASFDDLEPGDLGLLALLQLVGAEVDLPLVASGGIVSGRGVAGALAAGAAAVQLGTAFMLTREAATSPAHREALRKRGTRTALTRAFTGRTARGLVNRFMREHQDAPSAYPQVHHLTAGIRAAARESGDADGINLWAGQAYALGDEGDAGELVRRLAEEAREALGDAGRRLPG